ncbi:MAG TPA: energy transducer TonB [Gemmatimonadaceae bacterium]|nr:energy transducer TonB [Gemmatimonadaceae bacterium]
MLNRLLESKVRRNRSLLGMTTSISAHVLAIAAAVHATAQSRPRPPEVTRITVLPFVPERPRTDTREPTRRAPSPQPPLPSPVNPIVFDPKIQPIELMPSAPTNPTDFQGGGISAATGADAVAASPVGTFRADQVERQVALLADAQVPRYPESLRNAGIGGKVIAQFTVDERGLVEADSVRFIQSDNVLFEESVRIALQKMRFSPAEIGGRKVRQLVQMPFVFTISGR